MCLCVVMRMRRREMEKGGRFKKNKGYWIIEVLRFFFFFLFFFNFGFDGDIFFFFF